MPAVFLCGISRFMRWKLRDYLIFWPAVIFWTVFLVLLLVLIVGLIEKEKIDYTDAIMAIATGFIALVAWAQSKISKRDLLFREIEQLREDLESWANEMFVCTVIKFYPIPENIVDQLPKELKKKDKEETVRKLYSQAKPFVDEKGRAMYVLPNYDYEIIQEHAVAGKKDNFVRHMVTRHVLFPEDLDYFSKYVVRYRYGGDNQDKRWTKRFLMAAKKYKKVFKELQKKAKEIDRLSNNSDIKTYYDNSMFGILYKSLDTNKKKLVKNNPV